MKKIVKFYSDQNFFDFCLSNFGENYLDIVSICKQLGYSSYMDYYSDTRKQVLLDLPPSVITDTFNNAGLIIGSGNRKTPVELVYNNDLNPHTVIYGDYNNDYNNDYLIQSGVTTAVKVGYEGMNLTFNWSVTNKSQTDQIASIICSFTGVPDSIITVTIPAGQTYVFSKTYYSVSSGQKTFTINSDIPTLICSDSLDIYIMPGINFVSNNDFHYTNTSFQQGDTLNLVYSFYNAGSGTGVYNGVFKIVHNNVETDVPLIYTVTSHQTITVTQSVVLDSGTYSFISSFGDTIVINVPALAPNIVYNNDIKLNSTTVYNNTNYTLSFSYTNIGTVPGDINIRVQLSPSDQLVEYFFTATLQAGETKVFSQQVKMYYGTKVFSLVSNVNSDSLTINVEPDSNVAKNAYYVSNQWVAPKQWDQPIPTFKTTDSIIVYAWLKQPYPPLPGVTYYIDCYFYPDGVNPIYQQFQVAGEQEFEFFTLITTSSTVGQHYIDLATGGGSSALGRVYYNIIA